MKQKSFSEKCYELLRCVPRGRVTTYKEIAHALGTRAYRAVGNAMNTNPHAPHDVACHRVVNSDGSLGGYAWGVREKKKILAAEGVRVFGGKIVDFEQKLWKWKKDV